MDIGPDPMESRIRVHHKKLCLFFQSKGIKIPFCCGPTKIFQIIILNRIIDSAECRFYYARILRGKWDSNL